MFVKNDFTSKEEMLEYLERKVAALEVKHKTAFSMKKKAEIRKEIEILKRFIKTIRKLGVDMPAYEVRDNG